MKQTGYLIAGSPTKSDFFTTSSAYDRPRWVVATEATVYPTIEMAHLALTKLIKKGAYMARIVPLSEAIQFEFPNGEKVTPGDTEINPQDEQGMVAHDHTDVCPECGHEPCTCEQTGSLDHQPEEEEENAMSRSRFAPEQRVTYKGSEYTVVSDAGTGIAVIAPIDGKQTTLRVANTDLLPVSESSETMPAKPPLDSQPTDTNTPAEKVEVIKYAQDSREEDPDRFTALADSTKKVTVPADVLKDLKAAIEQFVTCADASNGRDDARASFCMTTADALKQLLADLEQGTIEGIKSAQIHMTSWMNPIVSNIPASVQKFVYTGGRKPSLKDLFTTKKAEKKEQQ